MSQVVDSAPWREKKQAISTASSIRKSYFQESRKFCPAESFATKETYWRTGIDHDMPNYTTTYKDMANNLHEADYGLKMPRIDKNRSVGECFTGYIKYEPKQHWNTTVRDTLKGTTHAIDYKPSMPKPGFDRLTANKTNYSLGAPGEGEKNIKTHYQEVYTKPKKVEQFPIGGWKKANGSYRTTLETREIYNRGGYGGEGSLGVPYDIIKGEYKPNARNDVLMRTGPRNSNNVKVHKQRNADSWGDVQGNQNNILTNKEWKNYQAPPVPTFDSLRRPDIDILRTRPW